MNRFAFPLVLIGFALSATACRCGGTEPTPPPVAETEVTDPSAEFVEEAVSVAATATVAAVDASAVPDMEALERHFETALAAEDNERVALVMAGFPRGESRLETLQMEVRGLQAMGRFSDARDAVATAMMLNPEDESLSTLMGSIWAADPEAQADRVIWTAEDGYELTPFHGSSSIIFEVTSHGQRAASFKPSQSIRRQYYRSEVAAYQLQQVLGLDIEVPVSDEVQIDWDTFHTIASLEPGDESFHETNSELTWFEESGERFLRGVAKVWIADLVRFPVEYTDAWQPMLDGTHAVAWLDETSLADAIIGFQERPREHYEEVVATLEHMTTFNLAHQLSDLHVFDVLLNNYDRYQPEGLQLGMNCHVGGAGITSLDNGAGFPTRDDHDWRRVRSKISAIRYFSRSTYNALGSTDPEFLRPLLFPPSDNADEEDDRFEYFVERWHWMQERISSLIEEHGEANVLIFD